jgi:hypothetical protein
MLKEYPENTFSIFPKRNVDNNKNTVGLNKPILIAISQ